MSFLFDLPRFLRTREAAQAVGLCSRTLEKHRTYGTGPKYRKIGGRVVYDPEELKAWVNLGIRTSTSDTGASRIFPAKARYAGIPRPRPPTRPKTDCADHEPPAQKSEDSDKKDE